MKDRSPFFWPNTSTPIQKMGKAPVRVLNQRHVSCHECGLWKTCKTPKMGAVGKGLRKIFILMDYPEKSVDELGRLGRSGNYILSSLRENGIDLHRDCRRMYAVNCRPPKNRLPKPMELLACRPRVMKEIEEFKPTMILVFGGEALKTLLGPRLQDKLGGITKWRGESIPDRELKAWVCPMFHPSFVLRENSLPATETFFRKDMKRALKKVGIPVPKYRDEKELIHILKEKKAIRFLRHLILHPKPIAIDYETTGLKPHAKGHKIVCCSIADSYDHVVVFMMTHKIAIWLREVLKNKKIGKIGSNLKYEYAWSRIHVKCRMRAWLWDTMLAAHIGDNRSGVTSIKHLAYLRFGLLGYSKLVDPYLKSANEKDGNSKNRIEELIATKEGRRILMVYCGMDSLLEYREAHHQMKAFCGKGLK